MADQSAAEAVLFEVAEGVAWVTINRPEARNAVNQAVSEGLAAAWDRVEPDDDIAVTVLTGSVEAVFSAGADLKEMAAAELAGAIAANAPLTVRAGKAMIRATAGLSPAEARAAPDNHGLCPRAPR